MKRQSLADLDTAKRKFNFWGYIRKTSLEIATIIASWAFVELLIWSFNKYTIYTNIFLYAFILLDMWALMKITPKIIKNYKKVTTLLKERKVLKAEYEKLKGIKNKLQKENKNGKTN